MLECIEMIFLVATVGTPKARSLPLFLPPRRGGHLLTRPLQVDAGLVDMETSGTM
jgi:hypothetical protein